MSADDGCQQRPMSQALVTYARTLPAARREEGYDLRSLAADLLAQVRGNLASNNVVIPVLQTFNVLLEADAFEELYDDSEGLKRCVARLDIGVWRIVMSCAIASLRYLLSISSKGVAKFKSVQRVATSMRM